MGKTFYPLCINEPELQPIFRFIVDHPPIEHIVLGSYMQQHPKLYRHISYIFNNCILSPALSPSRETIAITIGSSVFIINLHNKQVLHVLPQASNPIFSPNSKYITITHSNNAIVSIYSLKTMTIVHNFTNAHKLIFGPTEDIAAIHCFDGINIIRLRDETVIKTFINASFATFHPNDRIIAIGTNNHIDLYNRENDSIVHTFEKALSLVFHPYRNIIALYNGNNIVQLISTDDYTCIRTIKKVSHPTFSPNGEGLALYSMHKKGYFTFISLQDNHSISIPSQTCPPTFSNDGRFIAIFYKGLLALCGFNSLQQALQKIP